MDPTAAITEPDWPHRDLRVPREDGTIFARPPLDGAPAAAAENAERLDRDDVNVQGRPLRRLREWARRDVLRAAQAYTQDVLGRPVPEAGERGLLFCTGHQPALYHPGVWIKNFAASRLAGQAGGTALNLVIDNDTAGPMQVAVPTGDRRRPAITTVPFDDAQPARPWEEIRVQNRELFRTFGPRVTELMRAWGVEPLVEEFWPEAVDWLDETNSLRDALTGARAVLERRWGAGNLELPLSRLCETDAFRWFAAAIFAHAGRFRQIHNGLLAEFRRVNGVRSQTRPVPALVQDGPWTELPFWVWREDATTRRRLFVRQDGREVVLSDGSESLARLPLTPQMDACCAVEALRELSGRGVRLRTRALTTTLFARLCLADLFIHGIGGAKYDEITDRIITRFFGLPAPRFLTLSCTLHLPLARPFDVTADDERRLRDRLRDLTYNADRWLAPDADPEAAALSAEKRALIAQEHRRGHGGTRRERRARSPENRPRFRRLREINARLAELAAPQRARLERDLEAVQSELAANQVLRNREFPFVLYPEDKLRPLLTGLDLAGR